MSEPARTTLEQDTTCVKGQTRPPSKRSLRGLDWLNFFLADVQTGVGPFLSAGNVVAAVSMGLLGHFVSNRSIFFFVVVCTLPTLFALHKIRADEIDYERARGARKTSDDGKPVGAATLLQERPLVIFLICAVMFHFANAAMLPLLGEMLAKGHGRSSMMFMSACVVTTHHPWSDWYGGHVGAALGQTIAGAIVHRYSFDAGFLFLAAIAATAFCILYFLMPETREKRFFSESL